MKTVGDRLLGLDVLRGFAALAVMLHHHGGYYDWLYPGRASLPVDFFPGHFGVELFFIISGFVVLMTTERSKGVQAFVLARATRLLPAYLAALLLATIIVIAAPMPPLDPPTLRRFLANLTMAPLLFDERVIDLPYWTLNYEVVFYLFMALVLWSRRLRSLEWIALAWMALGALYLLLVDPLPHHRTTIVAMPYYSNFFTIGMCLYLLHAGRGRWITWVTLAMAIAISARGGGPQAFEVSGPLYFTLTVALTALVWGAAMPLGQRLAARPLAFLGRISYPLYLVHVVIGFEIIRIGVERGWSTWTGVVIAGAASLLAATLLHVLIEVPGQRLSRAALTRWTSAGPAPVERPVMTAGTDTAAASDPS